MFVCLHKILHIHFAKLRILPDREYENEHDVSIYFALANNRLRNLAELFLLEISITQRTGKEL